MDPYNFNAEQGLFRFPKPCVESHKEAQRVIGCLRERLSEMHSLVTDPIDQYGSVNIEYSKIVAAALRRSSEAYVGCFFERGIGVINLYFHDVGNRSEFMNTLMVCGRFHFENAACSLFPSLTSSGNTMRIQLSVSSLNFLVEQKGTGELANFIFEALWEVLGRRGSEE